mgnify:CR=1 FL=1
MSFSLKSNWCRELNDWLGITVKPDIYTGDIIVTNYEKVGRMIDMIGDYVYNFKGVIFDEAHMIKTYTLVERMKLNVLSIKLVIQ